MGIAVAFGAALAVPLPAEAAPQYLIEDAFQVPSGDFQHTLSLYNPANQSTFWLNTAAASVTVIGPDNTVTVIPVAGANSMTLDAVGNVWVSGSGEPSGRNLIQITTSLGAFGAIVPDLSSVAYNAFTGLVEAVSPDGTVTSVDSDLHVQGSWQSGVESSTERIEKSVVVDATTGNIFIAGVRTPADGPRDSGIWVFSPDGTELASFPTTPELRNLVYNAVTERVYTVDGETLVTFDADLARTVIATPSLRYSLLWVLPDGRVSIPTASRGVVTLIGTDDTVTQVRTPSPAAATMDTDGTTYQVGDRYVLITRQDGSTRSLALDGIAAHDAASGAVFNAATGRIIVMSRYSGLVWAIAPGDSPTITTTTLPSGTVGSSYNARVDATGSAELRYSITSGILPDGLALDAETGSIAGTPTTDADVTITITARNAFGSDERTYRFSVAPITPVAPVITTLTLPNGLVGVFYSSAIEATAIPDARFEVTEGSLPTGVYLSWTTGELRGTPREAGSWTYSVTATNAVGSNTRTFTQTITDPSAPSAGNGTTGAEGTEGDVGAGGNVGPSAGSALSATGFGGAIVAIGAVAIALAGGVTLATIAVARRRRRDV